MSEFNYKKYLKEGKLVKESVTSDFDGETWEDQRDNSLNRNINTPSEWGSQAYVKVDKSQIESPIEENEQYVIINGNYSDGEAEEDDCYLIIDKKTEEIVGYDHWSYENLIRIFFK